MGAHHPFSTETGDLSNRRDFLTLFFPADTTLSQPNLLWSLLASPQLHWSHACPPMWEKLALTWHVRIGNPVPVLRAQAAVRPGGSGDRQHTADTVQEPSSTRQASNLPPNPALTGTDPCPATSHKRSEALLLAHILPSRLGKTCVPLDFDPLFLFLGELLPG